MYRMFPLTQSLWIIYYQYKREIVYGNKHIAGIVDGIRYQWFGNLKKFHPLGISNAY